jgi:hypothetical protein
MKVHSGVTPGVIMWSEWSEHRCCVISPSDTWDHAILTSKNQLHEKVQGAQDKAWQKLFDGKAQIVTAPEFKQLVQQLEMKHQLEKDEKAARAAVWVAKAVVKAASAQAKRDVMDKYEQDMAAWRDECAIFHANGKCGKALPPKPLQRQEREVPTSTCNQPFTLS